ncbi:MAG: D-isomer specific 2-hydroxyacid dehydrogenase family protein [Pelosinus sp.]|nr:D-isomer specific 2-hydroxyacid dehydrogenase family protein [Pelosinus sp.]
MEKVKVCVFNYREFDEAAYFKKISKELGIELVICKETPTPNSIHIAKDCDYISIITTPINRELMKMLAEMNIKMISTRTIGFDHIDMASANEYGILVSNATYSPNGVADYAIMLMLMAARKMKLIIERASIQDFSLPGLEGREFASMTVGIIGTGRIGQTVIRHLSGFGCELLAYDLYHKEEVKKYAQYVSLDEIIQKSDVISLHAPLNDNSYHMINAETIDGMKDHVILVNTARGALIDTDALINGIETGKIGAAALDVIENEAGLYYNDLKSEVLPNHDLAILRNYPNVLVTPHMAFYTDQDVHDMVYASLKSCTLEAKGEENPWRVS